MQLRPFLQIMDENNFEIIFIQSLHQILTRIHETNEESLQERIPEPPTLFDLNFEEFSVIIVIKGRVLLSSSAPDISSLLICRWIRFSTSAASQLNRDTVSS